VNPLPLNKPYRYVGTKQVGVGVGVAVVDGVIDGVGVTVGVIDGEGDGAIPKQSHIIQLLSSYILTQKALF
jgi:nitrogen fixation/metabolism regulation signal transduction histidine kinase